MKSMVLILLLLLLIIVLCLNCTMYNPFKENQSFPLNNNTKSTINDLLSPTTGNPGILNYNSLNTTSVQLTWITGGMMRAFIKGLIANEISASTNPIGTASNFISVDLAPLDDVSFGVYGSIDDLRIYDIALTADEVLKLYN